MKKKIKRIKFYHSIKCSTKPGTKSEFTYLTEADGYNITIDGNFIRIESPEGEEVYTTVSNVVFFVVE